MRPTIPTVGNQRVLCLGDTDAVEQISIFINAAGLFRAGCDIGGVTHWLVSSTSPVFLDD